MKRLIGVIHLPALFGAPRHSIPMKEVIASVRNEARIFRDTGFDGVIVENFGDAPFYAEAVPPVTVACMTVLAQAVRDEASSLPVGINVLRNDARAALGIAAAVDASFVRINVHIGVRVTDQGMVEGRSAETLRLRRSLGIGCELWCDVNVKHSAPVAPMPLEQEVSDLVLRAGADAVLVTGSGTGKRVDMEALSRTSRASEGRPVYVASGATIGDLPEILSTADGVIVGSALREGGAGGALLDAQCRAFARAFRGATR